MKNNKYISLALLGSLVLATPTFAHTSISDSTKTDLHTGVKAMLSLNEKISPKPVVVGTVTSINGNTIVVLANKVGWGKDGKDRDNDSPKTTPSPISYTVDASHATVTKAGASSTVSAIAVGDKLMVQGTLTGTNIVATNIRDNAKAEVKPKPTPLITGNGQPIVMGTISAINGSTITITNKSNVSYTVDASNAKIQNKNSLSTVSTLAVGDSVIVQGTISGTSIVAYSVIDQGVKSDAKIGDQTKMHGKFISSIGRFFQVLFGF